MDHSHTRVLGLCHFRFSYLKPPSFLVLVMLLDSIVLAKRNYVCHLEDSYFCYDSYFC